MVLLVQALSGIDFSLSLPQALGHVEQRLGIITYTLQC